MKTFHVLIAPVGMLTGARNSYLDLQRCKILFISGNYFRILSQLDRNITELEILSPAVLPHAAWPPASSLATAPPDTSPP